jgi:hypothetical protein
MTLDVSEDCSRATLRPLTPVDPCGPSSATKKVIHTVTVRILRE